MVRILYYYSLSITITTTLLSVHYDHYVIVSNDVDSIPALSSCEPAYLTDGKVEWWLVFQ